MTEVKSRVLSRVEIFYIGILGIILFFSQLAIGGGNNSTSLCITTSYGLAAASLAAQSWARRAISVPKSLGVPAVLFFFVAASALLSMSPVNFDRPHSVVSLPGAYSYASVDRSRTLLELVKLLGLGCIFLVGCAIGRSATRARFAFQTLTIFGVVFELYSIITFAIAPTTLMGFGHKDLFLNRLTASFLSANTAGTFFGTCVLLALGCLLIALRSLQEQVRRGRWIESFIERCAAPIVAILAATTALLLSASRTAVFATAFSVLLLILTEGLSRRWSIRMLASTLAPIVIIAVSAASLVGGGAIVQRLNFLQGDSLVRVHIYQAHAAAMNLFSWSGFGLGTFETVNRSILLVNIKNYGDLWTVRAMHDVFLQWIEGAGWLGAFPMFICVGFIMLWMTIGAVKNPKSSTEIWTVLAISLLILTHGLTDFALENPSVAGWWSILMGTGYARATQALLKNSYDS